MSEAREIEIRVRFFAILRDHTGIAETCLQIPDKSSVDYALQRLVMQSPELARHADRIAFAVNLEYVTRAHLLNDGDELALIPPVSGG